MTRNYRTGVVTTEHRNKGTIFDTIQGEEGAHSNKSVGTNQKEMIHNTEQTT